MNNSVVTNCSVGTGGFGATPGGLFGQPAQTNSLFKPFGQATTTPQNTGFSFGGTNTMGLANTSSMVSAHTASRVIDDRTDVNAVTDLWTVLYFYTIRVCSETPPPHRQEGSLETRPTPARPPASGQAPDCSGSPTLALGMWGHR